MQARDVMSTNVIRVRPDTPVTTIARILVDHHVSAVPVVDGDRLVGLVSEGDLLHRRESGTEQPLSWWSEFFRTTEDRAKAYLKARGQSANDVMSTGLQTIGPDTELAAAADLMERHKIKRLPVVEDGKLLGIVSRADLLKLMLVGSRDHEDTTERDDRELTERVFQEIERGGMAPMATVNVITTDGVVGLWGFVTSETERHALEVAAKNVTGTKGVENHLLIRPPYLTGAF